MAGKVGTMALSSGLLAANVAPYLDRRTVSMAWTVEMIPVRPTICAASIATGL